MVQVELATKERAKRASTMVKKYKLCMTLLSEGT